MKIDLKIGDQVRYSAEWCRSTGNQTDDIPFARGMVKSISNSTKLVFVEWQDENIPSRVMAENLEVLRENYLHTAAYWFRAKDGEAT